MNDAMPNFEEAYRNLNPRQKQAVDTIEGPVMVIAGPGTGKTQILTLRIANILKQTDTPADAILALTFTEAAAANMRRRLVSLIGSRGYYVNIFTFHGFCNRTIQDYPENFPDMIGGRNAAEVEQIAIVREILEQGDFEHLKPFGAPFFSVPDILQGIRHLKKEGFSPEEFSVRVKDRQREFGEIGDLYHEKGAHKGKMKGEYRDRLKRIEKHAELARIYANYEKILRDRKLYDFEDMILETIRAFERKEDFLLEIQEKYQYLLVDEHQDTNGSQNRLLELLMSFFPNPNLFVVGDEKQAIYRFQGASLENFLYFKTKFPDAVEINLSDNYRSTQTILDSAASLIRQNAATLPNKLRAANLQPERKIALYGFDQAEAEQLFLAETAREKIAAGEKPEEIAILVRDNRDAFPVAEALEREGVPCVIESNQNILDDPEIVKILLLLEAIDNFGNDEKMIEALHIDFLNIDPLDSYKLIERRETRQISVYKLMASAERLAGYNLERPAELHSFYLRLKEWRRQSRNENFLAFFERVIRESGFLNHLLSRPGAFEKTSRLNALFRETKKIVGGRSDYKLKDFIAHLAILREHKVAMRAARRGHKAVRIMTAHSAKGLEFDIVFVAGLVNGHWGNRRELGRLRDLPFRSESQVSELERNEDERRLFYMALTRARREVILSYAFHGWDGKEQVPSQFLGEIDPAFVDSRDAALWEEKVTSHPEFQYSERRAAEPSLTDREFLRELFMERGFTATALNNYLDCPWKYFYENLVRIPRAYNATQAYGSAVHFALQEFFNAKRRGEPADEEFLVQRFLGKTDQFPLSPSDLQRIRKKGEKNLPLYFRQYVKEWNYRTISEYTVNGVMLNDAVRLHGKLDKLELQPDPSEAIVVDYKTGKPKSRAEIEGRNKDSSGNYKRQLIFYKLLLERHPEQKFRMRTGVIDFVEPNEAGKFKKEVFEITDAEAGELVELIQRVTGEILELKFWSRRCNDRECAYCPLRNMMAASVQPAHFKSEKTTESF